MGVFERSEAQQRQQQQLLQLLYTVMKRLNTTLLPPAWQEIIQVRASGLQACVLASWPQAARRHCMCVQQGWGDLASDAKNSVVYAGLRFLPNACRGRLGSGGSQCVQSMALR